MSEDPIIRRVAAAAPPVPEDELSPDSPQARALLERLLSPSAPVAVTTPARHRRRLAPVRIGVSVASVVAVAAVVLLLAGTFSGPDGSGTEPALAAVIPAAIRALDPAGSIFVEKQTYVSGPGVHGHPYSLTQIVETPAGAPASSILTIYSDPARQTGVASLTGWAYGRGQEQVYSAPANTIYTSSIWGPYLHLGRRPGTYVYRDGPGAPLDYPSYTVTARQARALLDGQLVIGATDDPGRVTVETQGTIPSYTQIFQQELQSGMLHYVGRRIVAGRPALELAGTTNGGPSGDAHVYLDPSTHLPIEEVDLPGTAKQQVIRLDLRRLPITPSTERLLTFQAHYPSARVDSNHADYLRATHGETFYDG